MTITDLITKAQEEFDDIRNFGWLAMDGTSEFKTIDCPDLAKDFKLFLATTIPKAIETFRKATEVEEVKPNQFLTTEPLRVGQSEKAFNLALTEKRKKEDEFMKQ